MHLPQSSRTWSEDAFLAREIELIRGTTLEDVAVGSHFLEKAGEKAIAPLCQEIENGRNGSRGVAVEILTKIVGNNSEKAFEAIFELLKKQEVEGLVAKSLGNLIRNASGEMLDMIDKRLSAEKWKLAGNKTTEEQVALVRVNSLLVAIDKRRAEIERGDGVFSPRKHAAHTKRCSKNLGLRALLSR